MRIDKRREKDKYISKGTAINSGASPEGSFMLLSDLTFWGGAGGGLCCMACGISVFLPGTEPTPPAVKVWSLNHWAARDVLISPFELFPSVLGCVWVYECSRVYTCVISFCEPSSTAAAIGASEWWQLIMKHYAWCVPFISSCRSLAFPRNPPADLCNPGKEVSIWKQLLLR